MAITFDILKNKSELKIIFKAPPPFFYWKNITIVVISRLVGGWTGRLWCGSGTVGRRRRWRRLPRTITEQTQLEVVDHCNHHLRKESFPFLERDMKRVAPRENWNMTNALILPAAGFCFLKDLKAKTTAKGNAVAARVAATADCPSST
uniref:SFRICE_004122 n=1 Tax=Spodoptera frugiperda TaxID=7108 RepID=A0A2H1VVI1_SPOFR